MSRTLELDTPAGPARAHLDLAAPVRALLALGHGAGGGTEAPDLLAARDAAVAAGVSVARVEQPYRVAGRRSPAPAAKLDLAWRAAIGALAADLGAGLPLITGGRSSGARVACRTAAELGAAGVLCLAFPLVPPASRSGTPRPSRLGELESVEVPVLIIQGRNDRFGMPPQSAERQVVVLDGDHGLKRDLPGVRRAVEQWLDRLLEADGR